MTDNSGEIIFDLFVIDKLKKMSKRVIIGSKSEPILNDMTAEEVREMTDDKVVATGPVVGTTLDNIGQEAIELLFSPNWLVISKGMGNFETISEFDAMLKGRLIYIFRAKCQPVANATRVTRGTLVVKSI